MAVSPHIIVRADALQDLASRLATREAIGLDTEFLRERTYWAQLCLVQVAGESEAACIDPLALEHLEPLGALARASRPLKVLHAARQDLEVLAPLLGVARPVFDTQIAAALAGEPAQIGYAELARRTLGVTLAKSHTRTDWSRRPLSGAQLEYALDDVRHLLPMREVLLERLGRLGRLQWLEEELEPLAGSRDLRVAPEEAWLRVKGLAALGPERLGLARALAAWRERRAIERNRPRGWILDDAGLREILTRLPRTPGEIESIPGLPPAFVRHCGTDILALIEAAGLPHPPPPLPARARPDSELLARVRRLSSVVQHVARELNLSAEVLATRRDLEQLAGATDSALLKGWRAEVLSEPLRAAL